MAIRSINYTVKSSGINPSTVQRGGLQGEHRATTLQFELDRDFRNNLDPKMSIKPVADKIYYSFEAYTSTGLKNSTTPVKIDFDGLGQIITLEYPLENWLTRDGGNIRVYLIFSGYGDGDKTIDLYTYPALLRLDAVPDAEFTDGENHESISLLSVSANEAAERAESAADAASNSAEAADEAREQTESARFALESGSEFVFLGGDSEGGVDIKLVVDEELSAVSENPVQNRAVTEALNETLEELANTKGTVGGLEQYIGDVHNRVLACEEKVGELSSTVNGLPIPADYIVEQGYDGIWSYTKWNSGRITLHYSTRNSGITAGCVTEIGAVYCSDDITFDVPAQCIAFDAPQSTGSIASMYSGVFTWTQDTKIYCKFWSLTPATSTYRLVLDLEGRWK